MRNMSVKAYKSEKAALDRHFGRASPMSRGRQPPRTTLPSSVDRAPAELARDLLWPEPMVEPTSVHGLALRARDLATVGADGLPRLLPNAVAELHQSLSSERRPLDLAWMLSSLLTLAALARSNGAASFAAQLDELATSQTGALGLLNAAEWRANYHSNPAAQAVVGSAPSRRAVRSNKSAGKPAWSLERIAALPRRA